MNLTISVNHIEGPILEYPNVRLYGRPVAGGYQLGTILEGKVKQKRRGQPQVTIESLSGELGTWRSDGTPLPIGRLVSTGQNLPTEQFDHEYGHQATFELAGDRAAFEQIERVRANGDLRLSMRFNGIGRFWKTDPDQTGADLDVARGRWSASGIVSQQYEWSVPQSEWVRILKEMGYSERVLVEVGLPIGDGNPDLMVATGQLRKAHDALLSRRWPDAIAACRLGFERLRTHIGKPPDKKQQQQSDQQLGTDQRRKHTEYTKEERWRVVADGFYNLSSASHHADAVCTAITFTREDAVAMVACLAGMLQLYTS